MRFLQNASDDGLLRAQYESLADWETRITRGAGRGVFEKNGVGWLDGANGAGSAAIYYPYDDPGALLGIVDQITAHYRDRVDDGEVWCFGLSDASLSLEPVLVALGFERNYRPRCMALELATMTGRFPIPDGLRIEEATDVSLWDTHAHPYHGLSDDPNWRATAESRQAAATQRPQRLWHFVAWLDDKPVGHSTLLLTEGAHGVASIWDVGVFPAYRSRGIGKEVAAHACRVARDRGANYALLVASHMGQPGYERLGFRTIKDGMAWTFGDEAQARPAPTETERVLAESIASGDVAVLSEIASSLPSGAMNASLANGRTPIELAAHLGRHDIAEWLMNHGGTLSVLTAWDLGWQDRALALLAASPERVNERHGKYSATLLHEAALRGDIEFARFALEASPDLDIEDAIHNSTPLGWARFLGQDEIAALIEEHDRAR
ncbi:GNAT family N-acetyltransferase [Candidatus Poribacteria bacterium]|jgi:ribosomal protein S18 acetylase RimI-like enzyme|nr:GNAT family N-acetyltransferase [Candidatus Poribacteria bacterium]MBT5535624.1 GNAT family N-acetyltransferase [Candidatus Poribacteria bacterium]MBT5714883.1 GNAT family N-acetyltransferase [Candidatus Poribacteria bacterium]MBT7099111.1 GNAT family N-acetyltransferase [Candidatus Poribacteria bacterium]MBT7804309.1 GNAT family N-acetyltransferase [Candidatus Poribacteria bacterium]